MNEVKPENHQIPELSLREAECLTWCARGKSSWEIGRILNLSEDTINYHIKNAMRKLESSSRIEAVAKAVKLDLIEPWPTRGDMTLPMIVAFLSEDLAATPRWRWKRTYIAPRLNSIPLLLRKGWKRYLHSGRHTYHPLHRPGSIIPPLCLTHRDCALI